MIPTRRVPPLHAVLDVAAVQSAKPADRKIDHRCLTFCRQVATESPADVDDANSGAGDVSKNRGGLPILAFLEDELIGPQPERISRQLERHMVVAAKLELVDGIEMTFRQI